MTSHRVSRDRLQRDFFIPYGVGVHHVSTLSRGYHFGSGLGKEWGVGNPPMEIEISFMIFVFSTDDVPHR